MKAVYANLDMIAVFRYGEVPRPHRFRYVGRDGNRIEIKVDKVVMHEVKDYNTSKDVIYRCSSVLEGREILYEIKLIGRELRWVLWKI